MGGSYRASSPERVSNDHYPTPWSLVEQLLEKEEFPNQILEPCAGKYRAISSFLINKGFSVTEYDLFFGDDRQDFLLESRKFPAIITNPPFSIADKFLEKALDVVTHKIAMILPLDYLHGKARYDNFYSAGIRPAKIYTFVRRPMFGAPPNNTGTYGTGSTTFSWFIFEPGYSGLPVMDWIDNSEYIVGGGKKSTPHPAQKALFE